MGTALLQEVRAGSDRNRSQVADVALTPRDMLAGEQGAGRGVEHQLGNVRPLQPVAVIAHRLPHIRGFATNRRLARKPPHRHPTLARPERLAVAIHLAFG